MKQIHIHGKVFNNDDFKNLVIGGQTDADTVRFVLPATYADELDLASGDWVFFITYENKEGTGDTALLKKTQSTQSENIYLDWTPNITATQIPGKLVCQVFGIKKTLDDEVASRFTCAPFAVYIDEWINPEPLIQTTPSVIEEVLEVMAEYSSEVQKAIEWGHKAEDYAGSASDSANAAKLSETASAESASAAKESETNAKESELNSKVSETAAAQSASDAAVSASAAGVSEGNAKASEISAAVSQSAAKDSETNAKTSEENAEESAYLSEQYAKGTRDGIPVVSGQAGYQDNSKYYKELAATARANIEAIRDEAKSYVDEGKVLFEEVIPVAQDALDKIAALEEKTQELLEMRRAYSQTIGDGTTKVFIIRHNLNSYDFIAQVWSNADGEPARYKLVKTDLNTATITFNNAPPTDGITINIVGIDAASQTTISWDDVQDVKVTADQLDPANALTNDQILTAFEAGKTNS